MRKNWRQIVFVGALIGAAYLFLTPAEIALLRQWIDTFLSLRR